MLLLLPHFGKSLGTEKILTVQCINVSSLWWTLCIGISYVYINTNQITLSIKLICPCGLYILFIQKLEYVEQLRIRLVHPIKGAGTNPTFVPVIYDLYP